MAAKKSCRVKSTGRYKKCPRKPTCKVGGRKRVQPRNSKGQFTKCR